MTCVHAQDVVGLLFFSKPRGLCVLSSPGGWKCLAGQLGVFCVGAGRGTGLARLDLGTAKIRETSALRGLGPYVHGSPPSEQAAGAGTQGPTGKPLTRLLQSHHGGLLNQVPLDEAPEILAVHAQVGQLERVDGHLQGELLAAALAGHVGPGQGDDGGAGVRDAPGQALLCRGGGWGEQRFQHSWA